MRAVLLSTTLAKIAKPRRSHAERELMRILKILEKEGGRIDTLGGTLSAHRIKQALAKDGK